jgi:exodeoxyribonuclease VII large subunit
MEQKIYSVGQVNQYIKSMMDQDPLLCELCMRGEISNYKLYPSGHHYFSLKDADGSMRCVLFRGNAVRLRFRPENGMQVLVTGRISVFPRDGQYQFYVNSMTPDGIGDLYVAFEQLKRKLEQDGLFERSHKKPIPAYPHQIAVITSPAGAAIRDMLRILGKRYPLSKILLLPVRVQGVEAPAEIAGALRYANRWQLADLIITGRGGGSMEDLWAFNDERVARAIYDSEIPVISAVGHEPDVTISDYVADLRAATPSNAAELAVPDQGELRIQLASLQTRMAEAVRRHLASDRERLKHLSGSRVLQSPRNYLDDRRMALDYTHKQLGALAMGLLERKKRDYVRLAAMLDSMSPLKVLSRGYAMVNRQPGSVVKSVREVQPGDRITIRLTDGSLRAAVETVWEETP